jgi:hypothetical protein
VLSGKQKILVHAPTGVQGERATFTASDLVRHGNG